MDGWLERLMARVHSPSHHLGLIPHPSQTREYKAAAVEESVSGSSGANLRRLEGDLDAKRRELEAWCRTAYGEAFSAWTHISAVRLFTESVLRYGLPPSFQAAIVKPMPRCEEKARKALLSAFGSYGARFWRDDGSGSSALEGEVYPYVSFTLDVE